MLNYQFAEAAQGIAEHFLVICEQFRDWDQSGEAACASIVAACRHGISALEKLTPEVGDLDDFTDEVEVLRTTGHIRQLHSTLNHIASLLSAGHLDKATFEIGLRQIQMHAQDLKYVAEPYKRNLSQSAFTIFWDPEIVDESEYAALVSTIGDIVRSHGGQGVKLVETGTAGTEILAEVPQ